MNCEQGRFPDFFVGKDGRLRTAHWVGNRQRMTREEYLARVIPDEAHEGGRPQPHIDVKVLERPKVVDVSGTPVEGLGRMVESASEPIKIVVGGLDLDF